MANAIDTVSSFETLRSVWKESKRRLCSSCFGSDRVTGHAFEASLNRELREIRHRLAVGFSPHGLLALPKLKPSGGHRIICVPTIADRLLQFALLEQLRPRLKAMGLDNPVSYGLAKGADRSVLGARKFACGAREERPWVYKADIARFFDNLQRPLLKELIEKAVPQRTLRPLLTSFVDAEVTDGIEPGWRKIVQAAGLTEGVGVRQGMPLSPWFAGLYLRGLDRRLLQSNALVARYADDIVAFFSNEAECHSFHDLLQTALGEMKLEIGQLDEPGSKTTVYPPDQPAAFLGMEITRHKGRYRLFVPDKAFAEIEGKFAAASTPAGLLQRRVRLTDMGRFFRSLECGYLNAYDGAENRDQLRDKLETLARAAQLSVLETIFTPARLLEMSSDERRFIGIDLAD